MPNCIIGILSFLIILLVTIVYFNKAKMDSFEIKIYGYMIIIDLLITIFAIAFYFVVDLPETLSLIRDIVGKGICILFVGWYTMFSVYLTYLIILQKDKDNKVNIEEKNLTDTLLLLRPES